MSPIQLVTSKTSPEPNAALPSLALAYQSLSVRALTNTPVKERRAVDPTLLIREDWQPRKR